MAKIRMTRQEAKGIEEREDQIKSGIVELLRKNSEEGLSREEVEDEFGLIPLRAYTLLSELVTKGLIEEIAGCYFIKE